MPVNERRMPVMERRIDRRSENLKEKIAEVDKGLDKQIDLKLNMEQKAEHLAHSWKTIQFIGERVMELEDAEEKLSEHL